MVEEEGREGSSVYFAYRCSFFLVVGYGMKGRRQEKHQLMEGGVSKNSNGKKLELP